MATNETHYSVYDLQIASTLSLPELPEVDSEGVSPDVTIRTGDVTPVPEEGSTTGRRIRATRDNCRLTYEGIGSVLVANGVEVVCDLKQPAVAEMKVFRRLVENQALAILLLQRGLLVLHASAVSVGGRAAVFMGQQTAGKSTIAAEFHRQGHPVLSDDVVGIRFTERTPCAVPGVPEVRLSPDAVAKLGIEPTVRPSGDWGPEKKYYRVSDNRTPTPVADCYLLDDAETIEIVGQTGEEPFFNLVASTYAQGLLGETERTAEHFRQCATLLESARVQTLQRPRDFTKISEVVERVAEDVAEGRKIGE